MTFVKPPLPAQDFVDADGLWDQRFGPYTKEDMQARDAEMLQAVADWLEQQAFPSEARRFGYVAKQLREAAEQKSVTGP